MSFRWRPEHIVPPFAANGARQHLLICIAFSQAMKNTGCLTNVETKQWPLRRAGQVQLEKCEDLDEEEQRFQQDDAPPHTTDITITQLREKIEKRLNSHKAEKD